ncbi:MAG: copper resistance CopC family protein [Pseudomonadota bacterium]
MRLSKNLLSAIGMVLLLANAALAHSEMKSSVPADQAIVDAAPDIVSLSFSDEIRLTRIELTFMDQPRMDLDLAGQAAFATEFAVPLPALGPGTYRIEWRGLAEDGHAMQGAFSFDVE